jgi:hypothetical protein
MISFQETLDGIARLSELLKSAEEIETAVGDGLEDMDDLLEMMAFSHQKDFKSVQQAQAYIDQVLIPRMRGIRDSLSTSTEEHLKRLRIGSELAERLSVRLQMLGEGGVDNFLA